MLPRVVAAPSLGREEAFPRVFHLIQRRPRVETEAGAVPERALEAAEERAASPAVILVALEAIDHLHVVDGAESDTKLMAEGVAVVAAVEDEFQEGGMLEKLAETPAGEGGGAHDADVEEEDVLARGRHLREAELTGPAQGDALEVHGDGLGAVDEGTERMARTRAGRPGRGRRGVRRSRRGTGGRGGVLGRRRFAAELTGRARIPNPALHRHRQATGEFSGEPVGGGDIRRVGDRGTRVSLTGRVGDIRARDVGVATAPVNLGPREPGPRFPVASQKMQK